MFEDLIEINSEVKQLKCILPNGTKWETANKICDEYEPVSKEKGRHGCKFFTDDYCCHK